jgi:SAM-dependent methyltransferase
MKLKSCTGIALAAAVGLNANNRRTSSWVRSCRQRWSERTRQGERVVDVGCGTGANSIALAERVGPSGQVRGIDVSAPMLSRAASDDPGQFVPADATTYPFESAAFDLLFRTRFDPFTAPMTDGTGKQSKRGAAPLRLRSEYLKGGGASTTID